MTLAYQSALPAIKPTIMQAPMSEIHKLMPITVTVGKGLHRYAYRIHFLTL